MSTLYVQPPNEETNIVYRCLVRDPETRRQFRVMLQRCPDESIQRQQLQAMVWTPFQRSREPSPGSSPAVFHDLIHDLIDLGLRRVDWAWVAEQLCQDEQV